MVAFEVLHDRVLRSLGLQLLMTSTQEPNIMAPQSALCICSRKWQVKLIVPICFGTKTSKFCLRIISFSTLESELSFDLKDSEINFDRARSALSVKSLLGALGAICSISSDDGEDLFADELFVHWEWKARYEVEEQENEKYERNLRTASDGKFDT